MGTRFSRGARANWRAPKVCHTLKSHGEWPPYMDLRMGYDVTTGTGHHSFFGRIRGLANPDSPGVYIFEYEDFQGNAGGGDLIMYKDLDCFVQLGNSGAYIVGNIYPPFGGRTHWYSEGYFPEMDGVIPIDLLAMLSPTVTW